MGRAALLNFQTLLPTMPPSVASSSSTLVNAPVSLPLAKLSYCTTATLSSHMQWIHLTNQNDLFAVFDTTRRLDMSEQISEKHVLKLVNGKDLLVGAHQRPEAPPLRHLTRLQETVELETLRDQVRYDNERLRIQGVSDVERYMIIMVKRPLLAIAIRFRTAERMVTTDIAQRQLRFALIEYPRFARYR